MLDVYRNVTIELLSSHTSSITDAALTFDPLLALREINATEGRVVASNLTLTTPPIAGAAQATFAYANMNYVILGLIIDTVTASTAEVIIEDRLWKPLGLSTAGWGPNPETSTRSVDNPYPHLANGALGKAGLPIPLPEDLPISARDNPPALNTAGRAHMKLADFDQWLRLHVNATVQEVIGLNSISIAKLHGTVPNTGGYTYGAWVRIAENGGGYILTHDGSNKVNYVTAWIETQQGWSVTVTTNVGGEAILGTTWVDGTHKIAEGVLTGEIQFAL